jgi:dihydropyrimidinase
MVDLGRTIMIGVKASDPAAGCSIDEGRRFDGQVTHTIVRGRYALRNGVLVDDAVGSGRYISRALA